MNKINLFSIPVCTGTYTEFLQQILQSAGRHESDYACLANVHMMMEAKKNKSFKTAMLHAGMVLPDGKPLGWALRLLYGVKQERAAGMDLLPDLLNEASKKNMSVFFYGGTENNLSDTKQYLEKNYPHLKIAGLYSPPFRQLNHEEDAAIVKRINASGANLVFVILGCPKQEQWTADMKGRINAYMIGVGGALPVLIGKQKRAPLWMQHAGLEWLYRLSLEPGRLFKRYAVTNTEFIYLFMKRYLKLKVFNHTLFTSK